MSEEKAEISVAVSERALLALGDTGIEQVGVVYVSALRRKRALLLCERDGHVEGWKFLHAGLCERCNFVMDEERHEKTKSESFHA